MVPKNGVGNIVIIEGTMYKEDYLKILQENLHSSAKKLRLIKNFEFQQDS